MTTAGTSRAGNPTAGLTKDAGWEIGVSRTIDLPVDVVWTYLTSAEGVARWLGDGAELPTEKGAGYATVDGTTGQLRSHRPGEKIRLTWQPADWDHDSTVQLAVLARGGRTMLRFHQERLADATEREQQRAHWAAVLNAVIDELTAAAGS